MILTPHSAGKIWPSICIQDIVKPELHCQINLYDSESDITYFLYQICLTDKSDKNNYLYA